MHFCVPAHCRGVATVTAKPPGARCRPGRTSQWHRFPERYSNSEAWVRHPGSFLTNPVQKTRADGLSAAVVLALVSRRSGRTPLAELCIRCFVESPQIEDCTPFRLFTGAGAGLGGAGGLERGAGSSARVTNKVCSTIRVCMARACSIHTNFCLSQQPVPESAAPFRTAPRPLRHKISPETAAAHPKTQCGPGFSGSSCAGRYLLNSLASLRKQTAGYIGYTLSSQLAELFAKLIFFPFFNVFNKSVCFIWKPMTIVKRKSRFVLKWSVWLGCLTSGACPSGDK